MFELVVSDVLRTAHLLAVAVGFGVAVETETYMIRRRRTAVSPGLLAALDHRHRVILAALAAMWVTGLALVALRTGFQLSAFTPKLWAKVTVVTILSVNAAFVAEVALPILARHRGRPVAALPAPARKALFSVAGISAASWLVALALGASTLLKVAPASVFQTGLPVAYIAGIAGANLIGRRLFETGNHRVAAPTSRPAQRPPLRDLLGVRALPTHLVRERLAALSDNARHLLANLRRRRRPATPAQPATGAAAAPPQAAPTGTGTSPKVELRASDLAIAFAAKPSGPPRLRAAPEQTPAARAARARLAAAAADLARG